MESRYLTALMQNPELARSVRLEVTVSDLAEFAREIIRSYEKDRRMAEYLTIEEVARLTRRSKITLSRWHSKGILEHNQLDLYKKEDVEIFLAMK